MTPEETTMIARTHVIDPDYRRRALVARELHALQYHAEIYEDIEEFRKSRADSGLVFVADGGNGRGPVETTQDVRAEGATLPIVAYSSEPKTERIVAAMLAGALDYLAWPFEPGALNLTFHRLATEGQRKLQMKERRFDARARVARLSLRELQVLSQLVMGQSNKRIALALDISPRTVEIHRANVLRKIDAKSVADAVRLALYAGLEDDLPLA
jgi:FixJ family two-component response regulator